MAPMKRVMKSQRGAAKKPRRDPNKDKCNAVAEALNNLATELPQAVRSMLSTAAPSCLTTLAEQREQNQRAIVDMISEALGVVEQRLQATVTESQALVNSTDANKATLAESVGNAESHLASMQEATTAAKQSVSAETTALKAAKDELANAQNAQEDGDAELVHTEGLKAELDAVNADVFQPIRENAASSGGIKKLTQVGKQYNFEVALLESMVGAFGKEPANRASFDQIIFSQYESALNERIASFAKVLEEGQPGRTSRESTVLGCKAVLDEQTEKLAASKTALTEANGNEKSARDAVGEAKRAAAAFEPTLREKQLALEEATTELVQFRDIVLTGFNDLKTLAPPPPTPEPVAEETPAPEVAA